MHLFHVSQCENCCGQLEFHSTPLSSREVHYCKEQTTYLGSKENLQAIKFSVLTQKNNHSISIASAGYARKWYGLHDKKAVL